MGVFDLGLPPDVTTFNLLIDVEEPMLQLMYIAEPVPLLAPADKSVLEPWIDGGAEP